MSLVAAPLRSLAPLPAPSALRIRAARDDFEVRRSDIAWRLATRDALLVTVTIRNRSDRSSQPAHARILSAPFGAFLPQQPLTTLAVPAIAPHDTVGLSTVVPLAALARSGARPSAPGRRVDLAQLAEATRELLLASEVATEMQIFTTELRSRTNWAGNLHVFVGSATAERHSAEGLVVRREIENLISFGLGDGRPDDYRFRLDGDAANWNPSLSDRASGRDDLPLARGRLSDEGHEWVDFRRPGYLVFKVCPPSSAGPGQAELHVQRRSTGQTAVVEFALEPLTS